MNTDSHREASQHQELQQSFQQLSNIQKEMDFQKENMTYIEKLVNLTEQNSRKNKKPLIGQKNSSKLNHM